MKLDLAQAILQNTDLILSKSSQYVSGELRRTLESQRQRLLGFIKDNSSTVAAKSNKTLKKPSKAKKMKKKK